MAHPMSVPEKTLEHWSSQYVTYRYRSHAAQWWPANGEDIDVRQLPGVPGMAVQIELKTATPAGSGLQDVHVDLGQLWEYKNKPLGQQPFYAFPRPHWDGELEHAARMSGHAVTELAFRRRNARWWFAKWMVVLTTRQVARVLSEELREYSKRDRGVRRRLVRFDVKDGANTVWGDPKSPAADPGAVKWLDFWTELDGGGREGWPQLVRLAARSVESMRSGDSEPGAIDILPPDQVAWLLRASADSVAYRHRGNGIPFVTLVPDGEGDYWIVPDPSGDLDVPVQTGTDGGTGEPEDNRQIVFIDSQKLHS